MKVTLLATGVSDDRELAPATDRYLKRLAHYVQFDLDEIKCPKSFSKLGIDELKRAEGELILSKVVAQDLVVILDEQGKQHDSVGFSAQLQKWMNAGHRRIVFVVGGAFGFSEAVYARADHQLALSQMTLTHQMVRLFFVEQLYRAFTILRNEKYHH
jgi:23S rRNA (pseudouridine1915-N3)-methyltransferase